MTEGCKEAQKRNPGPGLLEELQGAASLKGEGPGT
jgi:hypothetical protein